MTSAEFKSLRKQLKLTQTQMGKQIGKTRREICRYETGRVNIPVTIIKLLCFYKELLKRNIDINLHRSSGDLEGHDGSL
jgi:transcriptional regulator with XRE-family HTH domain